MPIVLASIISDAADIVHAGTVGLLAVIAAVLGWVVFQLYKKVDALRAENAALQAERVRDAQTATQQLTERHDASVGVATLCVEALNRNVEGFDTLGERFQQLEITDHQTHGKIDTAMGKILERLRKL